MRVLNEGDIVSLYQAAGFMDPTDVEDEDYNPLRFDYSGRGMYGERCLGFTGSVGDLFQFAVRLAELDQDLATDLGDAGMRSDSMGRSEIFYWPSFGLPFAVIGYDEVTT